MYFWFWKFFIDFCALDFFVIHTDSWISQKHLIEVMTIILHAYTYVWWVIFIFDIIYEAKPKNLEIQFTECIRIIQAISCSFIFSDASSFGFCSSVFVIWIFYSIFGSFVEFPIRFKFLCKILSRPTYYNVNLLPMKNAGNQNGKSIGKNLWTKSRTNVFGLFFTLLNHCDQMIKAPKYAL